MATVNKCVLKSALSCLAAVKTSCHSNSADDAETHKGLQWHLVSRVSVNNSAGLAPGLRVCCSKLVLWWPRWQMVPSTKKTARRCGTTLLWRVDFEEAAEKKTRVYFAVKKLFCVNVVWFGNDTACHAEILTNGWMAKTATVMSEPEGQLLRVSAKWR